MPFFKELLQVTQRIMKTVYLLAESLASECLGDKENLSRPAFSWNPSGSVLNRFWNFNRIDELLLIS